jgi:hypothetical protein
MMTYAKKILLAGFAAAAMGAVTYGTSGAGLRFEAVYTSEPVDVRVWLDRGQGYGYSDDGYYDDAGDYYDVYPSASEVTLYVRAARSCYTTVYVIDTEGFIHVIQPLSPYDEAYLLGGRVYRYRLADYGFDWNCFGRGVAFAFAVSSPVPFGYASYGVEVFGPRVGFQIYGDPFVAARMFYLSILPTRCNPAFASVSYTRFYVREYVRYPSYLCVGWHGSNTARTYCGGLCDAHREYRIHAKDPFSVLRPVNVSDRESDRYTKIDRTGMKHYSDVRVRTRTSTAAGEPAVRSKPVRIEKSADARQIASVEKRSKSAAADRVVRSTKDAFVQSKRDYERAREAYRKTDTENRESVAYRTPSSARQKDSSKPERTASKPVKSASKSEKTAKRTKS